MATLKPFDDSSDYVYNEITETFSTWQNNCDTTFTFKLLTDDKAPGDRVKNHNHGKNLTTEEEKRACKMSQFLKVEIKPGESIKLPTKYDQAIRWVSPRTNEVVGGKCPLLTKVGEEDLVVSKAFDYKTAIAMEGAKQIIDSMKKENEMREALAIMEKQKK